MQEPDLRRVWRFDARAGLVVSSGLAGTIREDDVGECVRPGDHGSARVVVTDERSHALAAHGDGVPVLYVGADHEDLERPGIVGVPDAEGIPIRLAWLADRGRAAFRVVPRRPLDDARWLADIRRAAYDDEQVRRREQADEAARLARQLEAQAAHIDVLRRRIAELDERIIGIESSRSYRLALSMQGAADRVRRIGTREVGGDSPVTDGMTPVVPSAVEEAAPPPERHAPEAVVRHAGRGAWRPAMSTPGTWAIPPRVSVVVPTRDRPDLLRRVLHGLSRTSRAHEVVIVDNDSTDAEARRIIMATPHRVVPARIDFNFSRLVNRGVAEASGDVVILLNNDIEIVDPDWMDAVLAHLAPPSVGAVGALLRYPGGAVQHCGIAIGGDGPEHPYAGVSTREVPPGVLSGGRSVTAVSGACLAVRAEDYWALDGFDSLFATNYNDVDFCLRLARLGREVRVTSDTELVHHEGATRTRESSPDVVADWLLFRSRWRHVLDADDPFWPARSWAPEVEVSGDAGDAVQN